MTGEFFPKVIFHLTEEYFEIQGETSFIGHRKFENYLKLTLKYLKNRSFHSIHQS